MGKGKDPIRTINKGRKGKRRDRKDEAWDAGLSGVLDDKPQKRRGGGPLYGVAACLMCVAVMACVAGIFVLAKSVTNSIHRNAEDALQATVDEMGRKYVLTVALQSGKLNPGEQDPEPSDPSDDPGGSTVVLPGPDDPDPSTTGDPGGNDPDSDPGSDPDPDGNTDDPAVLPNPVLPPWADRMEGGDYIYAIQRGDTMCSVSAKIGCYVEKLAAYNGIGDVDWIYAGAALRVPPEYVGEKDRM